MSSAATGSLGALLMIAPLAAIPVFAIVGMPRFSSMVAAPGEEEEVLDLGASAEEETPAPRKARGKNPDDLFAPFESEKSSRGTGRGNSRTRARLGEQRTAPDENEDADDVPSVYGDKSRDARSPRRNSGSKAQFQPGLVHPESGSRLAGGAATGGNDRRTPRDSGGDDRASPRDKRSGDLPVGSGEDAARWLAAKERIQDLEISWHQLSPEEDRDGRLMFVFTCFVTTPGEPSHRYAASGPTPLDAVEATLKRVADFRQSAP